jgi:hypothetical protein
MLRVCHNMTGFRGGGERPKSFKIGAIAKPTYIRMLRPWGREVEQRYSRSVAQKLLISGSQEGESP